jgi:hypothetical protein
LGVARLGDVRGQVDAICLAALDGVDRTSRSHAPAPKRLVPQSANRILEQLGTSA